jgi:hypothetical protein
MDHDQASKDDEASKQSMGGDKRAEVLSPERRKEIAKQAADARWERQKANPPQTMPYSMFRGALKIGDLELECHVLDDGRRVLTQREMVRVLSGGRESGDLPAYLARNPLIDAALVAGATFQFKIPGQPTLATGYEATQLIEVCDSYIEANNQKLLKKSQQHLAKQSEIVIRACAKVGIIALIDEATGYQKYRAKQDLQLKLQAFIADDLQEWALMFPQEFWLELARLEGVKYSPRNRPIRWGKYIMMFVYDAVDGDIGRELRKKNPDPHFLKNHHQWLKKFGRDKVHDQVERVVTIMKLCDDMDDFRAKFARVFKKTSLQMSFEGMG